MKKKNKINKVLLRDSLKKVSDIWMEKIIIKGVIFSCIKCECFNVKVHTFHFGM